MEANDPLEPPEPVATEPVATEPPAPNFAAPLPNDAWRIQIATQAGELRDELERCAASAEPPLVAEAKIAARCAARAEEIATATESGHRKRLKLWWTGSDVESAWSAVHDGQQALLMLQPEARIRARLPDLREGVTTTLPSDGRATDFLDQIKAIEDTKPPLTSEAREQLRSIKAAVDSTSDEAHANVRNYRNWLLIISGVVIGVLIVTAIAHAAAPKFLFIPEKGPSHFGADVGQLEIAGAVGGLLMAIFAMVRLTVYSGPVALPLWQALVRIPSGAVAGLVGAALLQGGLFSAFSPQPRSALLAYAVLFGAAPEIVLRFLDNKVNAATAAAAPKNAPKKSGSSAKPAGKG